MQAAQAVELVTALLVLGACGRTPYVQKWMSESCGGLLTTWINIQLAYCDHMHAVHKEAIKYQPLPQAWMSIRRQRELAMREAVAGKLLALAPADMIGRAPLQADQTLRPLRP